MLRKFKKKLLPIFLVTSLMMISVMLSSHMTIESQAADFVFDQIEHLPANRVGIVLGTSRYLSGGQYNQYFTHRIKAAARLYRQGKIKYLIVSGDNSTRAYNEPKQMRDALILEGVPSDVIYSDYAGFRTLDSIIRCHEIFGQTSFTIISQSFHNKRAVYIARQEGLDAIGYNASDVNASYGMKTKIREVLARVKALIDVHILGRRPKFLGEKVLIG